MTIADLAFPVQTNEPAVIQTWREVYNKLSEIQDSIPLDNNVAHGRILSLKSRIEKRVQKLLEPSPIY